MTTSRMPSDYYASDQFTHTSNKNGIITDKIRKGSYNIVEKDYGDHKIIYHIPIEYGDDYDISQLEDMPAIGEEDDEEQQQPRRHNEPKLIHRRVYHQYEDFDHDNDDYVEEVAIVKPRRRVFVSPRRHGKTQVVDRIYEASPTREKVEYVIEDDYLDDSDNIPENEEVEYVVRRRVPKQKHVEDLRPIQRIVYTQEPSVPLLSSRAPPEPVIHSPLASHSPVRSTYQPSPRLAVTQNSSTLPPAQSTSYNRGSPPLSSRKQHITRSPIGPEQSSRPNISKSTEPPLRLMDVIAQNRAKRGSRIPKPRREVDEEKVYDPPTFSRNIIKNGFIVHK